MKICKIMNSKNLDRSDKIVKLLEYGFRLLLLFLAVIAVFQGEWMALYYALITFVVSFVPDILQKATKIFIIAEFRFTFLVFIILSQYLGEIHDFYVRVWWWDLLTHIFSAVFITLAAYVLAYLLTDERASGNRISISFATIFAFCLSLTVAVAWEIFEYFMDVGFGFNMQKSGLVDTMEDLITCLIGSTIACMLYVTAVKKGEESFVTKVVDKFIERNSTLVQENRDLE